MSAADGSSPPPFASKATITGPTDVIHQPVETIIGLRTHAHRHSQGESGKYAETETRSNTAGIDCVMLKRRALTEPCL